MAEQNPKVEALCHALGENFSMNSPEEKVQFRQIVVAELIKAGFIDATGNVVVVKTKTAPAVTAPATGGVGAVTESYQQFMSRRNTELKSTVAEWPQRKAIINEEWVAKKGKTAVPHRATGGAAAPKKAKATRKKTAWDLYMKEQMSDSKLKDEFKSGKDRLTAVAATWKVMTEADKAPWVTKLAGLVSPVVAPKAEPAVEAPVVADEEEAEEEGEDKDE
jgi:hypothetical protein